MIPPEGRDVQCSNCTTTWFQPGVRQGDATVEATPPPPEPPAAHREISRPLRDAPMAEEAEPPRRELDPEVRDVLREEAARETALREQEAGALEHQDEMPLEAPDDPVPEDLLPEDPLPEDDEPISDEDAALGAVVSDLVAEAENIGELQDAPRERARSDAAARYGGGDSAIEAQIAAAAAGGAAGNNSRRDLLPDIEEINSTLRATENRSAGGAGGTDIDTVEARPRRRAGTRLGFAIAVLIFAALIGVYVNAPRIADAVPQIGPALQGYVAQVDRLRGWIDEVAQGALTGGGEDDVPEEAAAAPEAGTDPAPAPEAAAEPDEPVAEPTPAVAEDAPETAVEGDEVTEGDAPAGEPADETSTPETATDG